MKLAAVAVGAAAGWYFFSHTAPGQAAVDAASGVMAMIKVGRVFVCVWGGGGWGCQYQPKRRV